MAMLKNPNIHIDIQDAYNKLNLQNGEVLTADHMGHIEDGISFLSALLVENKLNNKKFSFIGDSISTYAGYVPTSDYATYYPKGDVTSVEYTWWKKLANETGMKVLRNGAWSGSTCRGDSASTTSAAAGCSTKRIADLANGSETPDIVICYIGINDFGPNDTPIGTWTSSQEIPADSSSVSTFSEAYAIMVNKIMATYPKARVFCCTLLHAGGSTKDKNNTGVYPTKNASGTSLEEYNNVIRDVANGLGADIIELTKCGIHFHNFDQFTIDDLHPNKAGHELVKEKIKNELLSKY